jgi:DNA-binding MarR family transcriptional regulator
MNGVPSAPDQDAPFFDLFLRFNRKLMRILGNIKLNLPVNESHVLAEIAKEGAVFAKDVSQILNIEKSTLSRIVNSLLGRKLVVRAKKREDRRANELNLTPQGMVVLAHDVEQRNESIELLLAPLDQGQIAVLRRYHNSVADALKRKAVSNIQSEHPLEKEVRRLTRGLGVLGKNFAGTGLPVERCQILTVLKISGGLLPFFVLKKELPYELSALSRLISALTKEGLLRKEPNPKDKRTLTVALSQKGWELAAETIGKGEAFLQESLRELSAKEKEDFRHIMTLLLCQDESLPGRNALMLRSKSELEQGRAFLVRQLVLQNKHHHLPATILSRGSVVRALKEGDRILAVSELRLVENSPFLSQFVVAQLPAKERLAKELLSQVLRDALARFGSEQVVLSETAALSRSLRVVCRAKELKRGEVISKSRLRL